MARRHLKQEHKRKRNHRALVIASQGSTTGKTRVGPAPARWRQGGSNYRPTPFGALGRFLGGKNG